MLITKLSADIARLFTLMSGRKAGKLIRVWFHPSLHLMLVHRAGYSIFKLWPPFRWIMAVPYWPARSLVRLLYQAVIPARAEIGGGFVIMQPFGVVIHPMAKIGTNVTVHSQVVVDVARQGDTRCAEIGDEVTLQSGAKIIGPFRINHHATVCANTYVQQDVAAFAVVAGVPAHVVRMGGGGQQANRHRNPRRRRERNQDSNVRVYSDKREGVIHV